MPEPDELNTPVIIGVLGAARIVESGVVAPAKDHVRVSIAAIAARDLARAQAAGIQWGIDRAYGSYEELIEDPELNAIYIATPNAAHGQWAIKALGAGKHVLIEKPAAANAAEATAIVAAASEHGLVAAEAFHYRYHPLMEQVIEIIGQGEIGDIQTISGRFCCFLRRFNDVRWKYRLGGGATMDLGCYLIHLARHIVQEEPVVTAACANRITPRVDRRMTFSLAFPGGVTAKMTCALCSLEAFDRSTRRLVKITGNRGSIEIENPITPHEQCVVRLINDDGEHTLHVAGGTTYDHQLHAFVAAIDGRRKMVTTGDDIVANMAVIDAVYTKAGMVLRQKV